MNRKRRVGFQRHERVSGFVVRRQLSVFFAQYRGFALGTHQHAIARPIKIRGGDRRRVCHRRLHRRHVHQVEQLGAAKSGGAARDFVDVHVARRRLVVQVMLEDLAAATDIGIRHVHHAIESPRTRERGVERLRDVRRRQDDDAVVLLEPIHLRQQLVQRLSVLVLDGLARRTDGIDFVDEDDARRLLLRRGEELANALGPHAHEHFFELAPASIKEWHVRLARDRAREQGLTRSRWTRE
mmetsp:Transcript_719/g.3011  ORF Transcript_719/g.3011 Transcript_719/m.3011 type:complete len:240 (-) Transcript_719:1148-1867(-)